jgi:hypothetical protein
MRIIGKTRDYYDSVRAFGIDPNCVYIRKREEADIKDIDFDFNSVFYTDISYNKNRFPFLGDGRGNGDFHWKMYIIGFSGRLYPCVKLEYEHTIYHKTEKFVSYVYDPADIIDFLTTHKLKKIIKIYQETGGWNNLTEEKMNGFFAYVKGKDKECEDLFHLERIPTFVLNILDKKLVWNEILEDFQFYKVVDTFTAFQELSGYISGVLGGQSPKTVDISNEVMIHKRGFNDMSFKKTPGTKRGRNKNV